MEALWQWWTGGASAQRDMSAASVARSAMLAELDERCKRECRAERTACTLDGSVPAHREALSKYLLRLVEQAREGRQTATLAQYERRQQFLWDTFADYKPLLEFDVHVDTAAACREHMQREIDSGIDLSRQYRRLFDAPCRHRSAAAAAGAAAAV